MKIDSEVLRKKLNDRSIVDWMEEDKSPENYKQGYVSGLIKALAVLGEVEYLTEYGHERPPIELDLDDETSEGLAMVMGALSDKLNELELVSHSEKHIVTSCIGLMESVHANMLEYMQHMGFEYDSENEEERPRFRYTYFEIVQRLLLQSTRHSGGTSVRKKCEKLGIDSYGEVVIGQDCDV